MEERVSGKRRSRVHAVKRIIPSPALPVRVAHQSSACSINPTNDPQISPMAIGLCLILFVYGGEKSLPYERYVLRYSTTIF
jgi:hypothetical protein